MNRRNLPIILRIRSFTSFYTLIIPSLRIALLKSFIPQYIYVYLYKDKRDYLYLIVQKPENPYGFSGFIHKHTYFC